MSLGRSFELISLGNSLDKLLDYNSAIYHQAQVNCYWKQQNFAHLYHNISVITAY